MKPDTAREKFGDVVETEEGEVWRPEGAKIRGLVLKWAREVDTIEATEKGFDGEACVDHLWQWLHNKFGNGFTGVFQKGWYDGTKGFDRVSKKELAGQIETLYEDNDEFMGLVEQKCEEVLPDVGVSYKDSDKEVVDVDERQQGSREFYVTQQLNPDHDTVDRIKPDKSQYKYHMKGWVLESETIQHDDGSPNAEASVECFKDWIDDKTGIDSRWVIDSGDAPRRDLFMVPLKSEVVEWCRELWNEDAIFREHLKMKWNKDVGNGDEEDGDSGKRKSLHEDWRNRDKKKKGQQKIDSWQ